jgi:CheY-like chemotaxis protein
MAIVCPRGRESARGKWRLESWSDVKMRGVSSFDALRRNSQSVSDPVAGVDRFRSSDLRDSVALNADSDSSLRAASTKTLLLIDNVRLTRECLGHLLQSALTEYKIISLAHLDGASEPASLRADVVVMNVRSTRVGDNALRSEIVAVGAATHRAPILLLSDHAEADEARQAEEVGLAGVFPSNCSVPLLLAAIRLVVAGGQFYAPTVSPAQLGQLRIEDGTVRR